MIQDLLKRLLSGVSPGAASPHWPEHLRDYMSRKHKVDREMRIGDARFVVFDTETSGLDLSKNRLLSIAGVAMTGFEVNLDDTFDAIIAQKDVGGADAAVVHGLISSDLAEGLAECEAVARFLSYAGDAVLVAHHAAFDLKMLQKGLAECRGAKVWNASIDTAQLARRVEEDFMSSAGAHGADERELYRLDNLVGRWDNDFIKCLNDP